MKDSSKAKGLKSARQHPAITASQVAQLRAGVDDAAVGRFVRELLDAGEAVHLVKRIPQRDAPPSQSVLYCAQVGSIEASLQGSASLLVALRAAKKRKDENALGGARFLQNKHNVTPGAAAKEMLKNGIPAVNKWQEGAEAKSLSDGLKDAMVPALKAVMKKEMDHER